MEPSSRDPLVRRRTVITLGSSGEHPEPDSTSEVKETVSGRITITVKSLPVKLVEDEEPSRDDPCWITIRHVDSPAPLNPIHPSNEELPTLLRPCQSPQNAGFSPKAPEPTVPVRKSVSACELKPVFKMKLGNESKILHLAEQSALKKRQAPPVPHIESTVTQSAFKKRQAPPIPAFESNVVSSKLQSECYSTPIASNNRLEAEPPKTQDKLSTVPYSEWLMQEDVPDEKPRVSFDHKYQGELFEHLVAEKETNEEPKIEVIETEKSSTPKSILKNVRRNSDAGIFLKNKPKDEPDKLLAWKMEYHQREALVGSRLRALVARADEFFINHQNSNRLFPVSPFHLPDIEPLKLPASSTDESCDSSVSSSVESFPELTFNTSTSSEEYGKIRYLDPTPATAKNNTSTPSESTVERESRGPIVSVRRSSNGSSSEISVRRHSHPIPNPNHSFKPITSPVQPNESKEEQSDTSHRSESIGLKPSMPIDKATEIVRQFFQSDSDRSCRSSPMVIQPKKWSLPESSLLVDAPPSFSEVSTPTSAPSSCVSQGSQSERGRPQMRSRIPVRINRPTSTSSLSYNRSFPLCNNQTNSQQFRASSAGSRRIWSSSSSVNAPTTRNFH